MFQVAKPMFLELFQPKSTRMRDAHVLSKMEEICSVQISCKTKKDDSFGEICHPKRMQFLKQSRATTAKPPQVVTFCKCKGSRSQEEDSCRIIT